MDLDSLKYTDLRQLAKSVGLKANMKAEKLLKALKTHFEQQENSENGNHGTSDDSQTLAQAVTESMPPKGELVTTRRGKNQKRNYSGASSPKVEEDPVLGDAEQAGAEDGGRRSSKRRKVSSSKDTQTPVSAEKPKENQPGLKSTKNDVTDENNKVPKKRGGKIPRHEGLMKKAALKPTTPNFKKLHEAHFNKMESIDSYVQRRNKQMEVLRNSVKELKTQTESNIKKPAETKTLGKSSIGRSSLFSPGVPEKKAEKGRVTPASKPAIKNSAPFRPSVLSTNKINVRFSQATQDNEYKRSLVKTPARMSPMLPLTPTPGRKSAVHDNKSTGPIVKTPGVTPFIFSGSSATPGTNKKNMFDLKASLSRPLKYKPHKGKLKPFGATQENAVPEKTQTVPPHQQNYKQHQVQTREERRVKHTQGRKQKKEQMLGARRGIVVA